LMGERSCAPEGGTRPCYNSLVQRARVASEEIKKVDPCRPVAVGMISGGGPEPQGEAARRKMHTLPSIDAVTVPVLAPLTRYMRVFNLTGLPAISVPCGFSSEGLPVGLQLVGRAWDEATVLRAAHAYGTATEWTQLRPSL